MERFREEESRERLAAFVVKEEFLFAGYGDAVASRGLEGPLLDGGEDGLINAMAKAALHGELSDVAFGVDNDVYDDVATCAGGELGEIGRGNRVDKEGCNLDVALAEGVIARAVVRGERGCWRRDR